MRPYDSDIIVRFDPPDAHRTGPGLRTFPTAGVRVRSIWVHDWAFATEQDRDWFCHGVLCRLDFNGLVHFVGWDGSVDVWSWAVEPAPLGEVQHA